MPTCAAVAWGKLLLNLNNALNALAGVPLREEIADRAWRRLLASCIDEALAALAAAGIRPAKVGALPPALIPKVLRLPDALFRLVAAAQLRIDPKARSSMADDLQQRRLTEIDQLQGRVVALADAAGHAGAGESRRAGAGEGGRGEGRGLAAALARRRPRRARSTSAPARLRRPCRRRGPAGRSRRAP